MEDSAKQFIQGGIGMLKGQSTINIDGQRRPLVDMVMIVTGHAVHMLCIHIGTFIKLSLAH